MIGRAGREHDRTGIVKLLVDHDDEGRLDEVMKSGGTTVVSAMSNPDLLASVLLPEICRGAVKTLGEIKSWCSRSFCEVPSVLKAMELLLEVEAVVLVGDTYEPTDTGRCASRFYFHPADVYAWRENLHTLFEMGLMNDEVAPAWALGNVPFGRIVGDLGDRREIASDCRNRIPFGLDVMKGSMINVVAWWYLIGGPSPGAIRSACLERRRDFGRLLGALRWLNKYLKWDMDDFLSELATRVRWGITPELVPLCRIGGLGKGRAEYLYGIGVRSLDDMAEALKKIGDEVDDGFRKAIERAAGSGS